MPTGMNLAGGYPVIGQFWVMFITETKVLVLNKGPGGNQVNKKTGIGPHVEKIIIHVQFDHSRLPGISYGKYFFDINDLISIGDKNEIVFFALLKSLLDTITLEKFIVPCFQLVYRRYDMDDLMMKCSKSFFIFFVMQGLPVP